MTVTDRRGGRHYWCVPRNMEMLSSSLKAMRESRTMEITHTRWLCGTLGRRLLAKIIGMLATESGPHTQQKVSSHRYLHT